MAINNNLFTGQTEPAGDIHSSHSPNATKQLPVQSGKKFIRLNSFRKKKEKH